jgi:hypothetical protein
VTVEPVRRTFCGRRLFVNLLRTVHVVAMVGCGVGILTSAAFAGWRGYALALFASGLGMIALDRIANPEYFHQLDGLTAPLKLVSFATLAWLLSPVVAFWLVLVVSVLVAHAPGRLRHWRWTRT